MRSGFVVVVAARASAADYASFPDQTCYTGHGCIDIDTEGTAPTGSPKACKQRCDADESCDCVTFRYADGKCWKHSACQAEGLDTDHSYGTYIKSSGYVQYEGRKSYTGHGGIEIDNDDTALTGLDLSDCEAHCDDLIDCSCVSFRSEDGKCWRRSMCQPSGFDSNWTINTYVKKGAPAPTPPSPDTAPAYSEKDGLALAHLESALMCGEDRFNSWDVNDQPYKVDTSKVRFIQDSPDEENFKTHSAVGVARMTSPDGCFAVVRGTDGVVQSVLDAVFTMVRFDRDTCQGCSVHEGWHIVYESVRKEVFSTLEEFGCQGRPLYLTGHSLGAAVLHFLLFDALDANYTVAYATAMEAPRPGNQAFANALRNKVEASSTNAWRITHFHDIVPRVPPQFAGYRHALPEIYFGARSGTDFESCGYDDMTSGCINQWAPWRLALNKDHCWYSDHNPCSCGFPVVTYPTTASAQGAANVSLVI